MLMRLLKVVLFCLIFSLFIAVPYASSKSCTIKNIEKKSLYIDTRIE